MIYIAYNNEKFEVGEEIERIVGIKTADNGGCYLIFYVNKNDLEGITPENIFKCIGRENDYVKYFEHVDVLIGENEDRLNDKLDEMTNKLESGNRLWLFDYITILQGAFLRIDRTQYDEMRHINKIIIDIEEWILDYSGLLTKFSLEKRTETALKSEECIKRCKAYIEAIDIIEKGEQSNFLNETVSKLKMNSFIRNSKHVFSVLYNIVTLQPEFIQNNLKCLSELVEFTCKEITDTYIIERIVSDLYQYINNEKKQINTQLHYYRSKELDTNIFTNLVIGIGTLLNFFAEKKDANINIVLEKRQRQLFPSLCKYLSFITTKDNALLLINKALKVALNKNEAYRINGTILREVGENPEKLVEYIINMKIEEESKSLISNVDNIYCQYINNVLSIAYIPGKIQNKNIFDKIKNIYTIPGTFINVASLSEDKWEISDSILYYSEKWKNLYSINNNDKSQIDDSEKATIVVKAINSDYKSIVFCSRVNSVYQENGTIHYSGYSSNMFKSENLCDIFESEMIFEADIVKREGEKVSYSIIDNIKQFSQVKAKETGAIISGLCLGANKAKQEYVLLTENGILCMAKYDRLTHIHVGETYEIELLGSYNEDSYPLARVLESSNKSLDREELLKNQLREVSLYNKGKTNVERNPLHAHALPYIHLIIDNYLRVFDNKIIMYNLYHIAYMIAKMEKSTLAEYYASCIQFMELNEYFMENRPIVYSITPTIDNERVLSMFPSLRSRHVMKNVMTNFGSENDLEYLYNLSVNNDQDSQICKLARLSLAASLIESVSDDERPVAYLKGIAIECLGGTLTATNTLDVTSNVVDNDNSEEELNTYKNFGLESSIQEFKTSIVYLAGDNGRNVNNGEQLNVIMKVICGFLNAKGGTLYIGVADDGTPKGIEADLNALKCNLDMYERIIRDRIVKEFNKYINSLIELSFIETFNKHTVCKICIPEAPRNISLKNGDFYQRQGNETRIMKGDDLVSLIMRKAQGKNDMPFNSNIGEVNNVDIAEHVEEVDNTESCKHDEFDYIEELAPNDSDKNTTFVNFFIDGSYIISELYIKEDNIKTIKITSENINHYILQCYSNGCINKVPVKNINNLQLGYRYKNGLNITADLKQLVVLSDNDFVVFLSKQNNSSFIKVYPVAEISTHTTLGLKGNQLLSQNYDVIENILFVREKDKQNIERLISRTRSNLGYNMSSVSYRNEVEWITEYMKNRTDLSVSTPVRVVSEVDKVLNYAYSKKEKELELFIMTYLKDGRSIPKIREIIIDALKKCTNNDIFWLIVSVCFNCDLTSFRKPIADVVKVSDCRKRPNEQVLQKIVKQMFTLDQKYSQSIDFVYPIKEFLSDESIEFIRERTTGLSTPEYYSMYIDIVKMTKDDSINYLLNEGSVPSLYTIFLLLEKDGNVHECMNVTNRIQPINIHSKMVKDLISYVLLDRLPQFTNKRIIEEIQEEGYAAFHLACVNKMQRDKLKSEVDNIEEYKGRIIRAKIVQDYGHYYLLQIDSLLIILQYSWCSKKHYIGDVITVKVLSTYKKQRAMIATELIDVEDLVKFEPLLNIGTEVEVKISSFNGKYVPSIRNAFSKIEAHIVSYPADFDYKATYKAIVVRKRGIFDYDIRLTHKVN